MHTYILKNIFTNHGPILTFIFDGDCMEIHCNYMNTSVFTTVKTVPVNVRSPKSSNVGPG